MSSMPPLLAAKRIAKAFAGVHALKGVSFELRAGEVHALIGENGAGKSTLIKVMTGAVQPDSGELAVSGRVVSRWDPVHASGAARGKFAASQRTGEFAGTSHSQALGLITNKKQITNK
jgi:ABC-type sugar transport system ATPase subunit